MKARFVPFERARGQPLLVFAMVLGGWLVLRVLLWESPLVELAPARTVGEVLAARQTAAHRSSVLRSSIAKPAVPDRRGATTAPHAATPRTLALPPLHLVATAAPEIVVDLSPNIPAARVAEPEPARSRGHQPAGLAVEPVPHLPRWSGDAWLLLRKDSAVPLVAGRPAYGRSQAGAVLRYRLAPATGHRPFLYGRATRALAGAQEGEVAAGFAARPIPGFPVSVAAELRAYDSVAVSEVRPAVFAVTELPPAELPLGFRGEAYAQAGYVGGTFATAFVDGQARAERQVVRFGDGAQLRAGAAVSGGAQKHAERLDVGPSAAISFRLGEANARLALDYRFRVAGNAEPRNGPALTFSAGF